MVSVNIEMTEKAHLPWLLCQRPTDVVVNGHLHQNEGVHGKLRNSAENVPKRHCRNESSKGLRRAKEHRRENVEDDVHKDVGAFCRFSAVPEENEHRAEEDETVADLVLEGAENGRQCASTFLQQ